MISFCGMIKLTCLAMVILTLVGIQTILIDGKTEASRNRKPYLTRRDFARAKKRQIMVERSTNKSISSIVEPVWDSSMLEGDINLKGKSIESLVDRLNSVPVRQDDLDSLDNVVADKTKLWTFGLIPYRLSDEFDDNQRASIAMAIDEIHNKTCIAWIKARPSERDYVMLNLSSKCSSGIGRSSGINTVLLSPTCLNQKGGVLHELVHTLGFLHEQSRHDRDQYVDIQWHRLANGTNNKNFQIYGMDMIDNLNTNYDYSSIMHYPRFINGMEIIVPYIDVEIGQRERLSETDIYRIRKLYECRADKAPTEVCDPKIECVRRAKEGECLTNAVEMLLECRKYCLMCSKSPRSAQVSELEDIKQKDCPPDWIKVPGACYKVIGIHNFEDAEEFCQTEDPSSHLPVFRNSEDVDLFQQYVNQHIPNSNLMVFLAGNKEKGNKDSGIIWTLPDYAVENNSSDHSMDFKIPVCQAKFLFWAAWQPDNSGGNEECLALQRGRFTYHDVPCNLSSQFLVCQIPLFNICDCPPGWIKTPSACYKYIGVRSFTDAENICNSEHPESHLPLFRNSFELDVFKQNVESSIAHNNFSIMLLGSNTDDHITYSWDFPDYEQNSKTRKAVRNNDLILFPDVAPHESPIINSKVEAEAETLRKTGPNERCPLTFLDWDVGQPDYFGTKRCLMLGRRNYKYHDVPCTTTRLNLVCQLPFFDACLNIDDSDMNCCPYAFPRGCFTNRIFMKRKCTQSCGTEYDLELIKHFEINHHNLHTEDYCKLIEADQPGSPGPDLNADCAKYAQEGKCKSMPFHMSQLCQKSCNITDARYHMRTCGDTDKFPVEDGRCVNQLIQCEAWAWDGDCTKHPYRMHVLCCLACRRLDDVILKNCPK